LQVKGATFASDSLGVGQELWMGAQREGSGKPRGKLWELLGTCVGIGHDEGERGRRKKKERTGGEGERAGTEGRTLYTLTPDRPPLGSPILHIIYYILYMIYDNI